MVGIYAGEIFQIENVTVYNTVYKLLSFFLLPGELIERGKLWKHSIKKYIINFVIKCNKWSENI